MSKKNAARYIKLFLTIPLVLVWDVFYWSLSQVYKGASYVDETGGEFIDKFIND